MGTPTTALVTIVLDSFVNTIPPLPPVVVPVGTTLITEVPYPVTGDTVTIDLFPILGVVDSVTVSVPSGTSEAVVISPTLTANLTITVTETP